MRIYQPGETWISGEFASLLAIGDSWFWYPKNNILGALARHPRLQDPFRNIQVLGYNGAKLEEYVFGKYAKRLALELEPRLPRLRAISRPMVDLLRFITRAMSLLSWPALSRMAIW